MTIRSVLTLAPLALVAACPRGGPPQWDAGADVSLAVAPLRVDGGLDAAGDGLRDAGEDAAGPASSGEATGRLPQTRARPSDTDATFQARARALFEGIARDDAAAAMPFFFPVSAYAQVKAIADPPADWNRRLVSHYTRDIHALHARLGAGAARARYVGVDVPMDRARWVEPGEEYNRLGYYRVYGTKLRGEIDGAPVTIDVTSLISWRGEWFVVHLSGVK